MIKALEEILKRAETWPAELQAEATEILLSIESGYFGEFVFSAEDRAALARSAEDVSASRFVFGCSDRGTLRA